MMGVGALVLVALLAFVFTRDDDAAKAKKVAAGDDTSSSSSTVPGDTSSTTTADATTGGQATACPPADGSAEPRIAFDQAPPMCIDAAKEYTAEVETDVGSFTVALAADKAPTTVNNFVVLARYHYYDDVPFHRVIPGFVVQGGDAENKNGTGGPGYSFKDELPKAGEYKLGSLAMANSGPNTNGSQFFVITGPQGVALPPSYSLFGEVTGGLDVAKKIEADGTDAGTPKVTHKITKVTITEK